VARLDQLGNRFHVWDLADTLSRGDTPEPPSREILAPPRVILEQVRARGPKEPDVVVRARLSEPDADLRFYHNGVPVRPELTSGETVAEATVRLIGGTKNRIYAMASRRPGARPAEPSAETTSIDGLSNVLEVEYDGHTPGRTQILALGISDYRGQPLRYAHEDARAMAEFLSSKGLGAARRAEPIVLLNQDVTLPAVAAKFEELRRRVRRHPEDTVVIFLAGHTTVRRGHFCLLLPNAPLPDRPIGAGDLVVLRDPIGGPPRNAPLPLNDETLLPYLMIHFNLSSVDALQRVVIVDACEAEAIFESLENRRAFRRLAERNAREARVSYILATRRGERAGENPELEHGLLTYTLLRGMGKPGLRPIPDLDVFRRFPTADFNGDGWIETAELQRYARMAIPALAERFPGILRGVAQAAPDSSDAETVLSPDVDSSASFRLIEVPARR
jgi:hypothetical protein